MALDDKRFSDEYYQSGLVADGCLNEMDDYDREAIERFGQLIEDKHAERIKQLEQQLEIVRDNLRRGLSKSMQKLQARCIQEVLDGNYE